ncbi:hypothetical protein C1646_777383 [Rhizophagus diaphanus]|nr:hypothetical protein C1646_777383 [Rhizophagus diaphanus] [Rhizophagus sp. MUCL 43196]
MTRISGGSVVIKGLGFPKAFVKTPSWAKYNETLTATEIYEERYVRPLPNEGDIYVGLPWKTGKTYILKNLSIPDDVNLLVLSTRHSYSNAVTTRLNLKSYCDIDGNINLPDHKRVVCQVQSHLAGQSIEKLYKLIQEAMRIIVMDNDLIDLNIKWIKALQLQIKEYHGKSDPVEKAHDFSNVEESWKDLYRNEFWDKSDVIPHARLFGWRMVDFLREAGMIISIIEPIPKSEENILSQVVKANCTIIKAKEISDISNATIVNHETAKFLENKPKKTLEEMRSLDQYHIMEYYEILPELLTENFISKKDRHTTATQAEKHQICLELLKICTPAKDIDDRVRYKTDDIKGCLNTSESISYLQDLVSKMAQVFDNTKASRSTKQLGLITIQAKLGLLNSALHATYRLKFKAIDKNGRYYHLVGSFDSKDASALSPYQTGKEIYWCLEQPVVQVQIPPQMEPFLLIYGQVTRSMSVYRKLLLEDYMHWKEERLLISPLHELPILRRHLSFIFYRIWGIVSERSLLAVVNEKISLLEILLQANWYNLTLYQLLKLCWEREEMKTWRNNVLIKFLYHLNLAPSKHRPSALYDAFTKTNALGPEQILALT